MKHLSPIKDHETETEFTPYHRDDWKLVRCRETGFVFLANPPEYAELEEEFAWEKTTEKERDRRKEEPVVSGISSFIKFVRRKLFPKRDKMASLVIEQAVRLASSEPLKLLDVGCGDAAALVRICRQLETAGLRVEPTGVEVSKGLAEQARKNLNDFAGKVVQANALDAASALGSNQSDVILMQSFLEHERHPLRLLKNLSHILAPEGAVILKVPNFDCWNRSVRGNRWCGFRYPDHVNYFTPKTLRILAAEAGFTVSRQTFRDRFPTSDNMYAVLRKRD